MQTGVIDDPVTQKTGEPGTGSWEVRIGMERNGMEWNWEGKNRGFAAGRGDDGER
jgi:hypothetical protein